MRYNSILKEFNPNTFLTDYLQAKGIQGGEIEEFLHPDEKVLDNPFDYKNMDKAVEELSVLKQKNDMWGTKKIGVLIDCDVDGIMSASITLNCTERWLYDARQRDRMATASRRQHPYAWG